MAAADIVGFLTYVNFDSKSGCGAQFSASVSNSVQIYSIMADMAKSVIFNMAAATIFDFAVYQFWW